MSKLTKLSKPDTTLSRFIPGRICAATKAHDLRAHGGNMAADAKETFGVHRTMLHGAELRFPSPGDGREVCIRAFAEPDFARLFRPR